MEPNQTVVLNLDRNETSFRNRGGTGPPKIKRRIGEIEPIDQVGREVAGRWRSCIERHPSAN